MEKICNTQGKCINVPNIVAVGIGLFVTGIIVYSLVYNTEKTIDQLSSIWNGNKMIIG